MSVRFPHLPCVKISSGKTLKSHVASNRQGKKETTRVHTIYHFAAVTSNTESYSKKSSKCPTKHREILSLIDEPQRGHLTKGSNDCLCLKSRVGILTDHTHICSVFRNLCAYKLYAEWGCAHCCQILCSLRVVWLKVRVWFPQTLLSGDAWLPLPPPHNPTG